MRILLTANASYSPPRGGATRSNLIWLDHLAHAGHACRVVAGPSKPGAEFPHHPSIQVIPVDEPAARVHRLAREIREFAPDWVLVSSEDLGHGLLRDAHRAAPDRVVLIDFSNATPCLRTTSSRGGRTRTGIFSPATGPTCCLTCCPAETR